MNRTGIDSAHAREALSVLEKSFVEVFNDMQARVYLTAANHGWWDGVPRGECNTGEKIALMHSELSEALEAARKGLPADKHCPMYGNLEVELADVVIRIMDYAQHMGLDVAGALVEKARVNDARPYKHGGKAF